MSSKSLGTVKWFSDRMGFGFIVNQSGQNVFFQRSEIQADGYRRASDGDSVTYFEQGTNKLRAIQVEVLADKPVK